MSERPPPGLAEVLVVDDDAALAENVAELLARGGRRVRVAHDPEQALSEARRLPFDLAVLDVRLPRLSGVDLATRLREICPESEIVLMTANASLDTVIAAVGKGAFAYVQKPFDSDELAALAARALEQVTLRRERARLERELARSEALYRNVVDGVDAFILGLDREGIVHMWNRTAADAIGFSGGPETTRLLAPLLTSPAAADELRHALRTAAEGSPVSDLELPLRGQHGERVVRWSFAPLGTPADTGPLVLAVGVDRTERLELERRAVEAEAMAAIGRLTAGLAHEIRNPLNAASLQLELIERGASKLSENEAGAAIERRVHIVREELGRLSNLLDDFLQLARPRAVKLEPMELGELLTEVVNLQEPVARAAGVTLALRPGDADARARGNPALIRQALVNLVLNAIEAMRERGHGRVLVGWAEHGSARVEISVEDDGPGIDPEIAERIFEPFVTSREAGTGLGLTIVKRIVERHGGAVRLGPRPGGGTIARIHLDRA